MASTKTTYQSILSAITNRDPTINTRSKSTVQVAAKENAKFKRKADCSPSKENKTSKRIALADKQVNLSEIGKAIKMAEQVKQKKTATLKKVVVQSKTLSSVKTVLKPRQNENVVPHAPKNKVVTRAAVKNITVPNQTALKPKETSKEATVNKAKRLSNEFEKTEDTLYSTAIEDIAKKTQHHKLRSSKSSDGAASSCSSSPKSTTQDASMLSCSSSLSMVTRQMEQKLNLGNHEVPNDVVDFDKENWDDVFQVSHYAMDIFNYLKEREPVYAIEDYMDRQICLSRWMRSLLVDWMVEIQESFELNHETLYLGVKLVDMYLSKMTVGKETLQLVGAAAMFIASKYDERMPPMVDDFLYICDGAYTKQELIRMEMNLLKVCNFDLGVPISYRFLRRYGRCAKITMPVLTLARFILEFSLMHYETVTLRDSKVACAALYLALRMKDISGWTQTLEFYTGYKLEEFKDIAILLNNNLYKPQKSQLMTVRNKYSHKIFFQVAKTPLIPNEAL